MSRQGRKRSLDDTEERSEEGSCILHFKGSNSEHFTFISKLKDPEVRWNNLLKIRDDRKSQPAGSDGIDLCSNTSDFLATSWLPSGLLSAVYF